MPRNLPLRGGAHPTVGGPPLENRDPSHAVPRSSESRGKALRRTRTSARFLTSTCTIPRQSAHRAARAGMIATLKRTIDDRIVPEVVPPKAAASARRFHGVTTVLVLGTVCFD